MSEQCPDCNRLRAEIDGLHEQLADAASDLASVERQKREPLPSNPLAPSKEHDILFMLGGYIGSHIEMVYGVKVDYSRITEEVRRFIADRHADVANDKERK